MIKVFITLLAKMTTTMRNITIVLTISIAAAAGLGIAVSARAQQKTTAGPSMVVYKSPT